MLVSSFDVCVWVCIWVRGGRVGVCVYGEGGGECVGVYGDGMGVYVGGDHARLNGFLLYVCICTHYG